jgi:hypothetical protein
LKVKIINSPGTVASTIYMLSWCHTDLPNELTNTGTCPNNWQKITAKRSNLVNTTTSSSVTYSFTHVFERYHPSCACGNYYWGIKQVGMFGTQCTENNGPPAFSSPRRKHARTAAVSRGRRLAHHQLMMVWLAADHTSSRLEPNLLSSENLSQLRTASLHQSKNAIRSALSSSTKC